MNTKTLVATAALMLTILPASNAADRIMGVQVFPANKTIQINGSFGNPGPGVAVTLAGKPLTVKSCNANQIVAELPPGVSNGTYRLTAGFDMLDVTLKLSVYGYFFTNRPIRIDSNGTSILFDQEGPAVNLHSALPLAGIVLDRAGDYYVEFDVNNLVPLEQPTMDLETILFTLLLNGMKQMDKQISEQAAANPTSPVSVHGSAIIHTDHDNETLELRALVNKRSQIFETMNAILDRYNATAQVIIQKMD
jgi:hypothetical protein